jgi:hypothetical protein
VTFGAFTIFDFYRLRRGTPFTAVPIVAGILLDVFNVFLLVLDLFGSRRDLARPCRRERRAQG